MEITNVKWGSKDKTVVNVDGMVIPIPCETWHKEFIDKWLKDNEPEPFQSLAERKAEIVQAVKNKATSDITALLSQAQQINAIARSIELVNAKVDGVITKAEEDELDGFKALYGQVKVISAASDAKVEEVNESDKPEEVEI